MHNLLTEEDKRKARKEYWMGFTAVFFYLSAFLGVIIFLLLLPSAIFSWSKEKEVRDQKQIIDQSVFSLESQNFDVLIGDIKEKVKSLKMRHDDLLLYMVIGKILEHKNSGIAITGFIFQPEDMNERKVTIKGVAVSRDILVGFSKSLEEEGTFDVNLPVSNFAKQNNIDFTLDVIVRLE